MKTMTTVHFVVLFVILLMAVQLFNGIAVQLFNGGSSLPKHVGFNEELSLLSATGAPSSTSTSGINVGDTKNIPAEVLHNSTTLLQTPEAQNYSDMTLSQSPVKELLFLHIPKTGGSAIEFYGVKNGYSWGYCLFQQANSKNNCPPKNKRKVPTSLGNAGWHYPVQYLPMDAQMLYDNATLFAVIRNPYSRAVSEFYHFCSIDYNKHECDSSKTNSPAYMNSLIAAKVKAARKCPFGKKSSCPFLDSGHHIPQYDFLFNGQKQIVAHVLHFENLQQEFGELMKMYGQQNGNLPVRNFRNKATARLSVDDLTQGTIDLINEVYANDFEIGHYKRIVKDFQAASIFPSRPTRFVIN
jgi:hypothetical protein